jgi:hypothetical protein
MTTRATATFDLDTWDEQAYDEREGAKLTRTRITKTFKGDVEGTSSAEMLMLYAPEEGSAAYVGFERIVARLNHRSGSFVLHHNATARRGSASATLAVVPDTGTGELRGLSGNAEVIREPDGGHTFILDYDLGA